jgi:transcriptional regulator with XRE-family HTH domain
MPTHDRDAPNVIISVGREDVSRGELDLAPEIAPEIDRDFLDHGWLAPAGDVQTLSVEQRFGQAILRLRLYRGWSQRDVQRSSGVHQSQISRLETGRQRGLSSRRIFAVLRALNVGEIALMPPPVAPQTALEVMLRGDPWERAGRAAERRVNRRRSA